MILLNAFYKGLTGVLGALLCYLLYLLYHFDKTLIRKYISYLKKRSVDTISFKEIILLCIINFFVVWALFFGILNAIFDWRILGADDCAYIAFCAGIIFIAIILFSYRHNLPRLNISPNLRSIFVKKSDSNIPDVTNLTTRFNYFYSFDFLPKLVNDYNEKKISFDDVISFSNIPEEYRSISKHIEVISSGLNNDNDILLYLINVPSKKSISEVCKLIIIRSKHNNFVRLYSLEYSISDYCVCELSNGNHNNLGFASNGDEFLVVCLSHFRNNSPSDYFSENIVSKPKEENKESKATVTNYSELGIRSSTPTTDIYGDSLSNRLKDIFYCIQEGADWMIKQMADLPTVSVQGRMETEIIISSLLSKEIDEGLLIQSLLLGNPLYNNIGITLIQSKIRQYLELYEQDVQRSFVTKSYPLLDFATGKGKLKIADFKIPDNYGHSKCPVFILQDKKYLLCHFDFEFEDVFHTPDYITKNKTSIIVESRTSGDIVFVRKEDVRNLYDAYFDRMAYFIYCVPLTNPLNLSSSEIYSSLEKNRIPLSMNNAIVGYAFSEGRRLAEGVAQSTGLIGDFSKNNNDLPS